MNNYMEASKKYVQANPNTFLSFTDGKEHVVKLLKDKVDSLPDMKNPGQKVEGIKYLVVSEGAQKTFFTTSQVLIQKLAEYAEGSEVVIKQVKKNTGAGMRTSYLVRGVNEQATLDVEDLSEEELNSLAGSEIPF